jgi:hypothetical protein
MALVLVFVLRADTPLLLGIAVSVPALSYGGLYTLFPAATASFFGEKNFGLHYGKKYPMRNFWRYTGVKLKEKKKLINLN